ncbi:threonine--tRNA ligase [Sulfolobus acidocaldarius]|uniref:Threonine--tRNA ligase catalytic subunit n=4 Tax=Sulfolobus acidocaldarius TaxID=2285 RepID=SYTC_SULAC|nr:threonine--tRNA ligase [Sulfolobus acidocaldarius]Q4J9C4.2 RecName: Full=Threonine--tRNA ligase catalytic subunit; AltName: Full=Threonyl-tRNA synthetase catalytic subunit; Short=ThrRS-cat [Sulfolobus acidocaldarius DSM 639]AGE71197.1 threonyl-tRNA synthetase [Sulfolobus acidocaldarius N8]AGE73467.1 threonyl-tRNA synthetase [Sulfolobus acidocaldarius Ron12/I]ALU30501.1 threonine--tRNA ligase [Sulfolobus acidocaldarius]ALU32765.1 threonine--tRNA ligase [Sulfolobus acidocaldarius]WCM35129.1 
MESYKEVWLKAGLIYALNLLSSGNLKPVEIGLGERYFYVDIDSPDILTLDEAKDFAKYNQYDYQLVEDNRGSITVVYNGHQIKLNGGKPNQNVHPKYFQILSISVHHPSPEKQYVRVLGVGFEKEEQLKDYLNWLEKVSEYDHRIIGDRLDLFSFPEEAPPGVVLFHPNGQIIRKEMMRFMEEINDSMGYKEVYTSHVYRSLLWKISGHYDYYKDKMLLFEIDNDEELGIKPMNCPAHILIYKSKVRSYKDLPIRFSEFGHVYRWEKKGELYGLLRVRGFTQDDGHIFLREDQIKDEIKLLMKKTLDVLAIFGFKGDDVRVNLSTRPDESIGTDEQWNKATDALISALNELNIKYEVKEKEGAFYGPKIDFDIRDSLSRWWQLSTIQVDFNLPERFKLEYVDKDGSKKRPVMVHRAIYGSIDRFMAILLEHFRGKLPTWLSPIQVRVLPITDEIEDYGNSLMAKLRENKIRVDMDSGEETLSKRIKKAYDDGVPYLIIVGRKEKDEGKVTVRARGNIEIRGINVEKFVQALVEEIRNKDLNQSAVSKLK